MTKSLTEKRQNGFRQVVCGDFVDRKFFDDILSEYRKATNYLENQVQRLQEQLNDANDIIDLYFPKDKKINAVCVKPINDYRKKWGVK